MADVTWYEYNTTGSYPDYTVSTGSEVGTVSLVEGQILSAGDQFVIDGNIFTYDAGADLNGKEVGFFATGPNGQVTFFASSPLTIANPTEVLTANVGQSDTVCFMAGTRIATPTGSANIEDLKAGDLVLTSDGKSVPVEWVGRQTVSSVFANPGRVLPIRIRAGALDEALPARDLLVSPCHALFLDGVLVQAGALVNGSTIVRETDVPASFVYYHVLLADHSLILAEGVPSETFVDNVDRVRFDNWAEHVETHPELATIKEMPFPRACSARQVPASIVRKLASRVALIAAPLRAAG